MVFLPLTDDDTYNSAKKQTAIVLQSKPLLRAGGANTIPPHSTRQTAGHPQRAVAFDLGAVKGHVGVVSALLKTGGAASAVCPYTTTRFAPRRSTQ